MPNWSRRGWGEKMVFKAWSLKTLLANAAKRMMNLLYKSSDSKKNSNARRDVAFSRTRHVLQVLLPLMSFVPLWCEDQVTLTVKCGCRPAASDSLHLIGPHGVWISDSVECKGGAKSDQHSAKPLLSHRSSQEQTKPQTTDRLISCRSLLLTFPPT